MTEPVNTPYCGDQWSPAAARSPVTCHRRPGHEGVHKGEQAGQPYEWRNVTARLGWDPTAADLDAAASDPTAEPPLDPEIYALVGIVKALEPLDQDRAARSRVLQWAIERYGRTS